MGRKRKLWTGLTALVVLFSIGASAAGGSGNAGIDIWQGDLRLHSNNVTGVDWLNPGGSSLNVNASVDLQGNTLSGLADPSSAQDAATRSWVNSNDNDSTVDGCSACLGIGSEVSDPGGLSDGDDNTNTNTQLDDEKATSAVDMGGNPINNVGDIDSSNTNAMSISVDGGGFFFYVNDDESNTNCNIDSSANLFCDGSKNWVHSLNSSYRAVYSAQESPHVRAVYEGNVTITEGWSNVSLPGHFSKTVSDERPSLRVQVTPHELATVAVTDRSDSWIVIEASKDVAVDYRVTGIREGYEDKKVIRRKSE